jgi:hypothetical protein
LGENTPPVDGGAGAPDDRYAGPPGFSRDDQDRTAPLDVGDWRSTDPYGPRGPAFEQQASSWAPPSGQPVPP